MDVRCEKCQTEYELDESRLKPGGVTVKCTNCGHMFKIRKRAEHERRCAAGARYRPSPRAKSATQQPPCDAASRAPTSSRRRTRRSTITDLPSGPSATSAQWLVRLENGETKTCRELATLQQWIVAGVVSRESLISRSGKTWKRLGDIAELGQYFVIADEARAQRAVKPTGQPANRVARRRDDARRRRWPGGADDGRRGRASRRRVTSARARRRRPRLRRRDAMPPTRRRHRSRRPSSRHRRIRSRRPSSRRRARRRAGRRRSRRRRPREEVRRPAAVARPRCGRTTTSKRASRWRRCRKVRAAASCRRVPTSRRSRAAFACTPSDARRSTGRGRDDRRRR